MKSDPHTPVRRHALSGLRYGALSGAIIHIGMLAYVSYLTDETRGLVIMALAICWAVILFTRSRAEMSSITALCMLGALVGISYLGFSGGFYLLGALLGACFFGPVLWSMPGMAIGAVVGAIQQLRLPRAHEAPRESPVGFIAIPLAIGLALWVSSLLLASHRLNAEDVFQAAHDGHMGAVELLVRLNPDLVSTDIGGDTPLDWASGHDYVDVAKFLLAHGADVNARGTFGFTPLHSAAQEGYGDVTELLLANKADVNANSDGLRPLHLAASNGHKDVAKLLLAHGADVNAKAADGATPLHWAARTNRKDMAEFLLGQGADVNARANKGETPLSLAYYPEMRELLRKNGGHR